MKKLMSLLLTACALFIPTAYADNYGFLKDAPISFFTDSDYKLFNVALKSALDQGKNGARITWNNPKSGARGYFIPTAAPKYGNANCRRLSIYTEAQGRTGKSSYIYCRINNEWKIPPQ